MIDIIYILFGLLWLAMIFAVGAAIIAGIGWLLGETSNSDASGAGQRLGGSPTPRPVPINAPAPPMTAAQNAFQNTHGATALNAARNSGQNI